MKKSPAQDFRKQLEHEQILRKYSDKKVNVDYYKVVVINPDTMSLSYEPAEFDWSENDSENK